LLAGERAEVCDFQSPTRLDRDDLALVLVFAALELALPGDRAARSPIGLHLGAEHELLDELRLGQGAPHLLGWGIDFALSSRNMSCHNGPPNAAKFRSAKRDPSMWHTRVRRSVTTWAAVALTRSR